MTQLFEHMLVADRRKELQRQADATHLRRQAKQHRRQRRRM
jgi:hypothetical protein